MNISMGFCLIGEGREFIESVETMLDGRIPVNTSGGSVSRGHSKRTDNRRGLRSGTWR